jgi:hypothetical protein
MWLDSRGGVNPRVASRWPIPIAIREHRIVSGVQPILPRVRDLRLTASTVAQGGAFGAPRVEDEDGNDEAYDECPVEDCPGREAVSKAA